MQTTASQQPSWWTRNWMWAAPVGCLGLVALLTGFVALIAAIVFGSLRSSWAYETGMHLCSENSAVVEALGTPLQAGFFVTGSVNVNGPSGNADLSIPLEGPRGSGTLYVTANRTAGEWRMSLASVDIEGRASRIDLLTPGGNEVEKQENSKY